MLTASEHFNILGWSDLNISQLTDNQARELAGQAMAAPCIVVGSFSSMCVSSRTPGLANAAAPSPELAKVESHLTRILHI